MAKEIQKIEIDLEGGHLITVTTKKILTDADGDTAERVWRKTFVPGEDVTAEPAIVRKIANDVWTPAVVQAHLAKIAAQQ